ncbi:MAG: flagellar motor switch protein FliG [Verrucomicrobiota bacterium]
MALTIDMQETIGPDGKTLEEVLADMNKKQKLASLLVVLGPEIASEMLADFEEKEVEEVTTEMTKIEFVPLPLQRVLLSEFSDITMSAITSAVGGPSFAKEVLEKSYGSFKANEVISRVAPNKVKSIDTAQLRDITPAQLVSLLRREQIQTWALVLSYLPPGRCAEVLGMINPEQRTDIVERIATMEPTTSEVAQKVLELIQERLNSRGRKDVTTSGGTKILAEILNELNDTTSKQILTSLEERNPELSRSIKKQLFIFEDIGELDQSSLAKIMREVDFHVLAVALKTASDGFKSKLLGCLTKRAYEMINEEIQYMPPVRLSDVEDAQEQIIEIVRKLESSGEIVLSRKGGGDELIS